MPWWVPAALSLLGATAVDAAPTSAVVDLATRPGTVQRFLHVRPDAPKANVVFVSGGGGSLDIQDNGSMTTKVARCEPVVRNREALAARGIALGLVDANSSGVAGAYPDLMEVARYVRGRDSVPTWIMGGSSGSEAAALAGALMPADAPFGVILLSPVGAVVSMAPAIARPTLIVFHRSDDTTPSIAASIYANLTSAPVRDIVGLSGGAFAGCFGPHSFDGLDALFVATLDQLVDKHQAALAPPAGATATAVEYHNAALDHYFLTHVAAEIALLDGGTTIRGWTRTGASFKVYAAAGTGTSPVCRYYIPPARGDSHFYGRGTAECDATGAANPSFVYEDPRFFHVVLPAGGGCPAGMSNVYRVFSNRLDANHRYMIDPVVRDQMVTRGWLAEGDGPERVVMCVPSQ